ncbi:MAG: RtcB family protein [Lentisphaerae bacterium]|nr:RtcB family protein [Lentisphaerota bacterium]
MDRHDLKRIGEAAWEIPRAGAMRVPARIYATEEMLGDIFADQAPQQAANVAQLPGIVAASLAMPDMHWGYGFPIGGVAAFDLADGVISPGGVGYDINCGVRLMASNVTRAEAAPRLEDLVRALCARVPTGVGSSGAMEVGDAELRRIAVQGARWARARGLGDDDDLRHIEEGGCMPDADPDAVSEQAWKRARPQVATLGSGNHFLEVGYVDEVYDAAAANAFGLFPGQVTVMIHCGSRGFGHQICDDFLQTMDRAARKYGIALPDRQLACAPVGSPEGAQYLGAMRCAVNYAFANRQAIAHGVREVFASILSRESAAELRTVYEVAHNIAKIESHDVGGAARRLCVHRKGATRAFAGERPEIPDDYRAVGQPVLVPGDMGRCSYVLTGTARAMAETFGSACHGAGRRMSRKRAIKEARGRNIARELAGRGIVVLAHDRLTLSEEMPEAYKDVSQVVNACETAGLSRRTARIRPLGCIKG